jgi:hypothetical protein
MGSCFTIVLIVAVSRSTQSFGLPVEFFLCTSDILQ